MIGFKKIIYIVILPTLMLIGGCAKDSDFIEHLNTKKHTTLPDGPKAEFYAMKTSAQINELIQFYDLSENDPIKWAWDFGDGETSSEQNPLHSYSSAGRYNVKLTVSNVYGSSTESKSEYIKVTAPAGTYTIELYTGYYAAQISWELINNANNNIVAYGGDYGGSYDYYTETVYLNGNYALKCYDSNGGGWSNGSYISISLGSIKVVDQYYLDSSYGIVLFSVGN